MDVMKRLVFKITDTGASAYSAIAEENFVLFVNETADVPVPFDPNVDEIGTITPTNTPIVSGMTVNEAFEASQGQIDGLKWEVKDASFTAEFGKFYILKRSSGGVAITITDPSFSDPADEGKGYIVYNPMQTGIDVFLGSQNIESLNQGFKLAYRFLSYGGGVNFFNTKIITDVDGGDVQRYDKIQLRRDAAANWTSNNPTLASGELGFETNTGKLKIGNGSTAWNSLAYFGDLGFTPENVANKATSLTSPDNTKYPTTLAVSNALSAIPTPDLQAVLGQGNEAGFQDDSLPAGSVSYESEDNNNQTIISQDPTNVSMYGKDITNDFQSNIAINSGSPEITKANITTAKATVVSIEDPTNDTNWIVPAREVDGDYTFAGVDDLIDGEWRSKKGVDEFIDFGSPIAGGTGFWLSSFANSGSAGVFNGASDGVNGLLELATNANASARAIVSGGRFILQNSKIIFQTKISLTALSTSSESYQYRAGLSNSALSTFTLTDGVTFMYDSEGTHPSSTASGNWYAVTANGSVYTFVDTGVAITTNAYITLRIEINSSSTEALFYINNTLVATITTNIPPTSILIISNFLNKTNGTTVNIRNRIDYNWFNQEFINGR